MSFLFGFHLYNIILLGFVLDRHFLDEVLHVFEVFRAQFLKVGFEPGGGFLLVFGTLVLEFYFQVFYDLLQELVVVLEIAIGGG